MKYTDKLGLKKPDLTDYVNVSDLNDNMDILDEKVGGLDIDLESHKADKATQDGYGHIRLQDIPSPEIATQTEAEGGVNNTKLMTPLRTNDAIENKFRWVDGLLEVSIAGKWKKYEEWFPDDTTGSPGSVTLIAGTMDAGYFGVVPANELFTGAQIASECGITEGVAQFTNEGWLKFAIDGQVIFKSKKTYRHSISWSHIDSKGCVNGTKKITKDGVTYEVTLMKGLHENYPASNSGIANHGSEWNRLMLPIHIEAKDKSWSYPNNVESDIPYWGIDFTNVDLQTHKSHGNGSRHLCQETNPTSTSSRIYRGMEGVSYSSYTPSSSAYSSNGWSPVLRVVKE